MLIRSLILVIITTWFQQTQWVAVQEVQTRLENNILLIELELKVTEGYHIQSANPDDPYLVATSLQLDFPESWRLIGIEFPPAKAFQLSGSEEALQVYSGKVPVMLRVDTNGNFPENEMLSATLEYQACDANKCYYPRQLDFEIPLE